MPARKTACCTWAAIGLFTVGCLSFGLIARAEDPKKSPETIEELVKLLGDDMFDVREAATKKLRELGEKAGPALSESMRSNDPEVRYRAGKLLVEMGYDPDPVKRAEIERLLPDIKGKDPEKRYEAARRLFELGPPAQTRLKQLLSIPVGKYEMSASPAITSCDVNLEKLAAFQLTLKNTGDSPFWVPAAYAAGTSLVLSRPFGNDLVNETEPRLLFGYSGRGRGAVAGSDAHRVGMMVRNVVLFYPGEKIELSPMKFDDEFSSLRVGEYTGKHRIWGDIPQRSNCPLADSLNVLERAEAETKIILLPPEKADSGSVYVGPYARQDCGCCCIDEDCAAIQLELAPSKTKCSASEPICLKLRVSGNADRDTPLWSLLPKDKSRSWYVVRNSEGAVVADGAFEDPKGGDYPSCVPAGKHIEETVIITKELSPGEYTVFAGLRWFAESDICAPAIRIEIVRPEAK